MTDLSLWSGRVALVTGASSGIGRAVARRLAREGMRVYACARRAERLADLEKDAEECAGSLVGLPADLRDEAQIEGLFREIRARDGGVAVLVNNAGLGYRSPLMDGSTADWREMLEVNVLALCICTREAVADMRRQGDVGHVVHISSMSAHRVPEGSGVYAATKHAVRALAEGLRQELRAAASAIRVTAISPGFVETEFAAKYNRSEEAAQRTYGQYPCIQPSEIADAVAYVLSQPPHVELHDLLMRPTQQRS